MMLPTSYNTEKQRGNVDINICNAYTHYPRLQSNYKSVSKELSTYLERQANTYIDISSAQQQVLMMMGIAFQLWNAKTDTSSTYRPFRGWFHWSENS